MNQVLHVILIERIAKLINQESLFVGNWQKSGVVVAVQQRQQICVQLFSPANKWSMVFQRIF